MSCIKSIAGYWGCRSTRSLVHFYLFCLAGSLLPPAASTAAQIPASSASFAQGEETPTGKIITPAAAHGSIFQELDPNLAAAPDHRATWASAIAVSPDGARLAILTNGFPVYFDGEGKILPEASTEYAFIFDITGAAPKQIQVLAIPNSFEGLSWGPASDRLFISGGSDDEVLEFIRQNAGFAAGRTFHLGHKSCLSAKPFPGNDCGPVAAGLAVSPDGKRLLVANIQNDSVSLVDLRSGSVISERDLRPGSVNARLRGKPGGSYPRAVVWTSNTCAYVASARDREVIALSITKAGVRVGQRMKVPGQPTALLANSKGSRLYVALDLTGAVDVFDTAHNARVEIISAVAPADVYDNRKNLGGANSNALALMPDERTLLVSNGGQNSVAIVRLGDHAMGSASKAGDAEEKDHRSATIGLVPTGWYPTGVAIARDGRTWFVINGKSPMGPNDGWCRTAPKVYCDPQVKAQPTVPQDVYAGNGISQLLAKNAHTNQLEHAGFLTTPAPDGLELARLTKQVAHNNRMDRPDKTAADEQLFSFLRQHIKHVIYVMKENRSYDQILGDLETGNGDSRLTLFPEKITPNHHALARNFVTLDNLLLSGEGSVNGRDWTWAAQTNDMLEHTDPLSLAVAYKGGTGGFPYGSDRGAYTAYARSSERHALDPAHTSDPDILPGAHSVYEVDGPGGEAGTGFIWNAALRAGLSIRAYGVLVNIWDPVVLRNPRSVGHKNPQAYDPALIKYTDPYYPMAWLPDFWRFQEWKYEFADYVANNSLPGLSLLWMPNDHLGLFDKAIDGVDTPETQMADNDYAVGLLVEAVAHSPYANNTIVVAIEDDASDGPDHVDAQRSVALFAGPYVRQHAVVSKRYTTVSVVKTIEELLGIGPIGLNDALAAPMSEIFDPKQANWDYKAVVPDVLRSTKLPLPLSDHVAIQYPKHPAAYWVKATAGDDFSGPDRVDPDAFNQQLWRGFKGAAPFPSKRADDRDEHR